MSASAIPLMDIPIIIAFLLAFEPLLNENGAG